MKSGLDSLPLVWTLIYDKSMFHKLGVQQPHREEDRGTEQGTEERGEGWIEKQRRRGKG